MKKASTIFIVMTLVVCACIMFVLTSCSTDEQTTTAGTPAATTPAAPGTNVAGTTAAEAVITTEEPAVTTAVPTTSQVVTTSPTTTTTAPQEETAYFTVNGEFASDRQSHQSLGNKNLLIYKDEFTKGKFSSRVIINNELRSGLVFAYSNVDGNESYYRFCVRKMAQSVVLEKVENGVARTVYSNYLSAGYQGAATYDMRIVLEDGKAYCYFWKTLYTVVDIELPGKQVGFFAEGKKSRFRSVAFDPEKTHDTADTIIFGHSYMEMWNNWKSDIATITDEFNLGKSENIGIGGSVASHWDKFKPYVAAYGAKKGIYNIGINDLTGGTSPTTVVANIKSTLLYLKEEIPEFEVVLLSVNHCNARTQIKSQISKTNELMRELCAQYDWMYYAELEYAFCNDGVNPTSSWFIDGLHPSTAGYREKIIPAIASALRGENQPTLDPGANESLLNDARALKMCALTDYSRYSYRDAEWESAKKHYDAAVAAINSCKTVKEVEALDLSSYINELKKIKRNADYFNEEFSSGENCSVYEVATLKNAFDNGENGEYIIKGDGHRINDGQDYEECSFTFGLYDISGEFAITGVIFNATQLDTLGIQGYMINYVTSSNYLQIWHFPDNFGTKDKSMTYIGGWVFPEEVEDTEFRAIVKNGYIYLYTEEDYQTKGESAYGCSVALNGSTQNVKVAEYTHGALGILNWNAGSNTARFEFKNISGKTYTAN